MTGSSARADPKPSPRSERRIRREEISRSQFIDAAEAVFSRKGFRSTTLKDIAEHADYSPASIYSFFENKSDLLGQIFLHRGQQLLTELHESLQAESSAPERLMLLGDFLIDFFRERPDFARLSLRYLHVDALIFDVGDAQQAIMRNYDEVLHVVAALLEEGQQQGEVRSGEPLAFAHMWMSMMSAFHAMDLAHDKSHAELLSKEEFRALVARAFTMSVRAPDTT